MHAQCVAWNGTQKKTNKKQNVDELSFTHDHFDVKTQYLSKKL